MKTYDLIELAGRNIRESLLRNGLTIVGIGVGVASLVSMLSLGIGLQTMASARMNQSGLFDTITVSAQRAGPAGQAGPPSGPVADTGIVDDARTLNDEALAELRALPEVREAYPDIRFSAELRYDDMPRRSTLSGVPQSAADTEAFQNLQGRFFSSESASEALLQASFAAELLGKGNPGSRQARGLRGLSREVDIDPAELAPLLGKTLQLRYPERISHDGPDALSNAAGLTPPEGAAYSVVWRTLDLTIAGITDRPAQAGLNPIQSGVLLPLQFASSLHVMDASDFRDSSRAGAAPSYGSITLKLKNPADAANVQGKVREMGFNAFSLIDVNSGLRAVFLVIDAFLGAFGSLALTVASIGIVNTLIMAILERRREIGIMKALGASDRSVQLLFFAEAGTLGAVGGVLGVTLGWLIGKVINFGINLYLRNQGQPDLQVWYSPWWLVSGAVLFAVCTSLLAGWYPASKAARLDPVQSLRYE